MKIVSLLGSPRTEGNSSTIARHVLKTAEALGAEVSSFELNRLTYRGCQGCYACKNKQDTCILNDGLTEVLAAVQDADVVLIASPVYYGDISSQLKGFMDRTFSYLVPDYRTNPQPSRLGSKKLIFVLAQGHPDAAMFGDIFPRYEGFLKWMGFSDVSLIRACGIGPGNIDAVPEHILGLAEDTGRQLMA
jgi:multimeric flavodoxin WrbA